jgi:hypothetical protein
MAVATKAQVEALRWLIERGRTEEIDSVDLWSMYEGKSDLRPHSLRVVAWKRISGSNMWRMYEAGLLRRTSFGHDRLTFAITEAGFEAARS